MKSGDLHIKTNSILADKMGMLDMHILYIQRGDGLDVTAKGAYISMLEQKGIKVCN